MLCGCSTPRNTEAAVQRDYSGDLLGLSRQMDSLRASFELSRRRITDKLSNLKLEHTTTYYTLPDSMGRQYPVYVSTTKADKDEQTTEKVRTDMMATIRRMELAVDSLSRRVDAALHEEQKVGNDVRFVGRIVNVLADERILDDNGIVDPVKLDPVMYDTFQSGYYALGRKVGQAWDTGSKYN